jgi:hypothetical protein
MEKVGGGLRSNFSTGLRKQLFSKFGLNKDRTQGLFSAQSGIRQQQRNVPSVLHEQ